MKRRSAKRQAMPPGVYEMYVEVTAAIDKYLRVYGGPGVNVGFEVGFMLSTIADQFSKQSGSDFRWFLIRMLLDDEEQKR